MSIIENAFLAAQSLGTEEKLELISRIWESIPPTNSFRPSDSDLELVQRRWVEYESGKVQGIPWEEVCANIEHQLDTHEKS
jgi:putative addiction module component (TIGR02574 family)